MKRFGLPQKERIKKKKEFELIYSYGKVIVSRENKLKSIYFVESKTKESGVKAAFAVHRKSGKSVWRNRVRRLLREAYRLNKHDLINFTKSNKILILIVFSLYSINERKLKKIGFNDIFNDMTDLISRVKKTVENGIK